MENKFSTTHANTGLCLKKILAIESSFVNFSFCLRKGTFSHISLLIKVNNWYIFFSKHGLFFRTFKKNFENEK